MTEEEVVREEVVELLGEADSDAESVGEGGGRGRESEDRTASGVVIVVDWLSLSAIARGVG